MINLHTIALLNPKGTIALQEHDLIVTATFLMLLIVVPVFILTFAIVWRYRAGNTKATYTPNWEHNRTEEFIWWAVPCIIIAALAVITWNSSHTLDPYKTLNSTTKPLTIQVVALDWKWLFIYPEQHIATVNYVQFPANTPIDFQITADAPMNSFWIPQLGGQIYAMPGMITQLHLMADKAGTYNGVSANFSGKGFAGMKFVAKASSEAEFQQWAHSVLLSSAVLDDDTYNELSKPSENNPLAFYTSIDTGLYTSIVNKFLAPSAAH